MEFENLGYRELQSLCKDFGLRANGKSAELKDRLRDYKLKLQASTTSHRRSSANMTLPLALEDNTTITNDNEKDLECPETTNDENKCTENFSPLSGGSMKEKKRKSSIVATFMEHIANNTKRLSLNEAKPVESATPSSSISTENKNKVNKESDKDQKSSFLPRMTMKALAMTKAIVKKTEESKTLQSNQDKKDSNKEIRSTIPKPIQLAIKTPKQIQVNKPLSWKPHTGKLKEFNVDTKSIIREAGPYDQAPISSRLNEGLSENENTGNQQSKTMKVIMDKKRKQNTSKDAKPLSLNKPLNYKPHTGKLKPANF